MGVPINIVSSQRNVERYVELNWTVSHFKERLELITGIPVDAQELSLSNDIVIMDTNATLDTLGLVPNTCIYVKDIRNKPDEIESEVTPFQLSDAAYAARSNTFVKWRKNHFPNSSNNQSVLSKTEQTRKKIYEKGICVDQRCIVNGTDKNRNGWVRFIGEVKGLPEGFWIGVEYDVPVGKNDGSFQGVRYFTTNPNYGSFLPPDRIEMCPPSPSMSEDLNEEI